MRGRRHKLQVSTFPFLAVLLCAMGSLILVLLVMDRKAHQAAVARAQREAAKLAEETARSQSAQQAEREKLQVQARKQWEQKRDALHDKLTREQIEMQLQMRKVREELQGIAARLHYEQDTSTQLRRKTQDERSRLQAEEQLLRTIRSSAQQTANQSKESSQALRRMTLDLLQIEQVLKDLKASKLREQKTFSVLPYHGRRGENRRPTYVECTYNGVIFHPERKTMSLASFLPGSRDPAGDVRAEVERRIEVHRQKLATLPANADKRLYLLLLLRPSGIRSYVYFQRALHDLPIDFGYEFIDDDWVLDFPADDEMPSSQPWRIAAKAPARAPPAVAGSPAPNTNSRPLAGAPIGATVGIPSDGIRGSPGGGMDRSGSWVRGNASHPAANTAGSSAGHTSGGGFYPSAQRQQGSGDPALVLRAGQTGTGGMGTGSSGGYESRHPSPLPPSFRGEGGGTDYSGSGASGVGFQGIGGGLWPHASNAGSAPGSGLAMGGSPGGSGSGLLALGPPQALSSGSGDGYLGSGTSPHGVAGIGPTGNGIPGNGWPGGGTTAPGPQGFTPGMGTSGDGRYVIARGNNNGDAPGLALNGGGGGTGTGGGDGTGTGNGGGTGTGSGNGTGTGSRGVTGTGGGDGTATGGGSGTGTVGRAGTGTGSGGGTETGGGNGTGIGSGGGTGAGGGGGTGAGGGGGLGSGGGGGTGTGGGGAGTGGGGGAGTGGGDGTSAGGGGGTGAGGGGGMGSGGNGTSGSGTAMSSAPGSDGASPGMQNSGANPQFGNERSDSYSNAQGTQGTQGVGGFSRDSGGPAAQSAAGTPMPANGSSSSDSVIFIDPLTGKQTTPPRPAHPPDDSSAESPPSEAKNGNPGTRRIRVVPVTGATGGGGGGSVSNDDESPARERAPTPSYAPPPRRLESPRPIWIHGGRDWIIYVECRAGELVLYPSQRTFPLAQALRSPADNPLIKAIQLMIDRRQASRRPGEPPYHPQVCLLVRPEHIRTFLKVYPALEALPAPKMRRNLDADDDVIGIVTGAVP